MKNVTHFRKCQLRLIAQAEQRLGATQFFAGPCYRQHLIRSHRMCARVAWIAAEDAIPAVVAAEVCERNKNLARICDHARLEAFPSLPCCEKKLRKLIIRGPHQVTSLLARDRA